MATHSRMWVAALSLLVFGFGCKSKEENNQECELACVEEYSSEAESCGRSETECLSGCSGADDWDCIYSCEDEAPDCQFDHILCVSSCPCAKEVTSCARDCPDEDTDCLIDCSDSYEECAGVDSPYLCATLCDAGLGGCELGCEEVSYDSAEFLTCRNQCTDTHVSCLSACE